MFWKFLNAAKFYDVDILIMGGDLTGKLMVPIIEVSSGRYEAHSRGRVRKISGDELDEFERTVRFDGFYPHRCSADEYRRIEEDKGYQDRLFSQLMADQMRTWVRLAEERLADTGVRCYIMPGNDDQFVIDEALSSEFVVNPDGRIVEFDGLQMLSSAWTNPTAWNSPREESDEQLAARLEKLVQELLPDKAAIFNLHCPPYGTKMDLAPKLTPDLKVVMRGGEAVMAPCGSMAVRGLIERYQPPLSFHGHIHEARAIEHIGETTCVNPGSRYSEGTLDGAIVELDGNRKVARCQLVAG